MKTQNIKLNFKKDSIVELNETQLLNVNGGTSPLALSILATIAVYTYYETGTDVIVEEIKEELNTN